MKIFHPNPINNPVRELQIVNVKNSIVTRGSLILDSRGVNSLCLFENLPREAKFRIQLTGIGSLVKNGFRTLKDGEYYFVFNLWGTGYYHWLVEVALKFLLFKDEIKSGTVFVPRNLPPFIKEFLELFAFANTKEISHNFFVKNLKVITNPKSGHYLQEHLLYLKRLILEKVKPNSDCRFKKIYVSRKNARARKVINEAEVTDYLEKQGFLCFDLENTSFIEQVKIFSNCETLVSMHGAALTNSVFMSEKGNVIEIYPNCIGEGGMNLCYQNLSSTLGLNHTYLFVAREFPAKKFFLDEDNVIVDLPMLKEAVSALP